MHTHPALQRGVDTSDDKLILLLYHHYSAAPPSLSCPHVFVYVTISPLFFTFVCFSGTTLRSYSNEPIASLLRDPVVYLVV